MLDPIAGREAAETFGNAAHVGRCCFIFSWRPDIDSLLDMKQSFECRCRVVGFSFYLTALFQWLRREWLIGKVVEGGGRGPFFGTSPVFACRDWGKQQNISVRIAGFRVKTWTLDLPNTSWCRIQHSSVPGVGERPESARWLRMCKETGCSLRRVLCPPGTFWEEDGGRNSTDDSGWRKRRISAWRSEWARWNKGRK
jgi:hypothetical protein